MTWIDPAASLSGFFKGTHLWMEEVPGFGKREVC